MEDDVRQIACFRCCLGSWGPEGESGDPEKKEGMVQESGGEGTACKLSCPARESTWRGGMRNDFQNLELFRIWGWENMESRGEITKNR